MNKTVIALALLCGSVLYSMEIPTKHAQVREFGESVQINAQVIQLSNAKQSVMSLVSGHIEEYYVKLGSYVKKGDKIALIKSISLSSMTADYISLRRQFVSQDRNYRASKKLYDKGMISLQELNSQSMQRDELSAKINALRSSLKMMGIDATKLKKASSNYVLYAHSSGKVSALLQSRHSVVTEDTPIISIIKNQAFYIKSFVPLKYARYIKRGQKISVDVNGHTISTHIAQILPEVDKKTQRVVVLSSVDKPTDELFVNAYVGATLYFDADKSFVAVEKSALSFFNNEWVVFVPKEDEHDDHAKHEEVDEHAGHDHAKHEEVDEHAGHDHAKLEEIDEHAGHDHAKHEVIDEHAGHDHAKHEVIDEHAGHDHAKHEEIDEHDDHAGHDDHSEEIQYEARVIKIVTSDDRYAAVLGLRAGEEYVSNNSYFVKSMMLKSSLDEHGH